MSTVLHSSPVQYDSYRLVLVCPRFQSILTQRVGTNLHLPLVTIERGHRPARQLQQSIKDTLQVTALLLIISRDDADGEPYAVAEVLEFQSLGELNECSDFRVIDRELGVRQRDSVFKTLRGVDAPSGPFSKFGWIEDAKEWLAGEAGIRVEAFGEIRQYNAGTSFALVHFGVNCGPGFWLKATGAPKMHELLMTRTLAQIFPDYVPCFVSYRDDWNAWISGDAGTTLEDENSLRAYEQTVSSLAALQIASTPHTEGLLARGCADERLAVLIERVPNLITFLHDAMERQTSTKVARLSARRIHEIGETVENTLARMQNLKIPDTLGHNDLNPGNVLLRGSRCVFIDWAEACVGNPFFTFERLRAQVARCPESKDWVFALDAAYRAEWARSLTGSQIDYGLRLAPLLAIASHLLGHPEWFSGERHSQPQIDGYIRSLARQMDREARGLELADQSSR